VAKESVQERDVRLLLTERFGVRLRRLSEETDRTADYELLEEGIRAAVVEVKTIEFAPRTAKNGWTVTRSGKQTWKTRRDNAPGRVGAQIHKAAGQLARYGEPKILVFSTTTRSSTFAISRRRCRATNPMEPPKRATS
jgi:hypothetical protein